MIRKKRLSVFLFNRNGIAPAGPGRYTEVVLSGSAPYRTQPSGSDKNDHKKGVGDHGKGARCNGDRKLRIDMIHEVATRRE